MIKGYLIVLILVALILGLICLLYATGILKRKVLIITVENLPLGIFKDNHKKIDNEILDTHIQEVLKSDEIVTHDSQDNLEKNFSGESIELIEENNIQKKDIVYWTPHGKNYHKTNTCRTLIRSKIVNYGSIDESGKSTKCNQCYKS